MLQSQLEVIRARIDQLWGALYGQTIQAMLGEMPALATASQPNKPDADHA